VLANPDLVAGSVAVTAAVHRPDSVLFRVTGWSLRLGLSASPGLNFITGGLVQLGLGPDLDLLHELVTGPVLELGPNLILHLDRFAVAGDTIFLLHPNLLSGAITGAVRVCPGAVPAGRHGHGCGAEHQSGGDSHYC
jgi:hypothetical protein